LERIEERKLLFLCIDAFLMDLFFVIFLILFKNKVCKNIKPQILVKSEQLDAQLSNIWHLFLRLNF